MKKIVTFIVFLLCAVSLNAQIDSIRVTPLGLTDVSFKSDPSTSYSRTISWVNKTFANPESVLKGQLEGESVTVTGFSKGIFHMKSGTVNQSYGAHYQLYITFDDSVVSYKQVIDKFVLNTTEKTIAVNNNIPDFYKKGKPKKMFIDVIVELEDNINELFLSYYNYLQEEGMSSSEAISQLKKYKEKLDLEIMTQEEYDAKKAELMKYIK